MNKEYLLLWGGVDISPAIYGQKPHPKTQRPNEQRDAKDTHAVSDAIQKGIPVIGVCRGAQLLCAMNGGTLYQHSDDHACSHAITTNEGVTFDRVTAGHHQVMNPAGNYVVYGYDGRECVAYDENDRPHTLVNAPEIIWYPDTKCLAIQPHPEWMPSDYPFNVWLNALIEKLTGVKGVF